MKKTELWEGEKVLYNIVPELHPFIYVYQIKRDIKEWWVLCAGDYETTEKLFEKQFLQLPN